jgi:hypothetical protein
LPAARATIVDRSKSGPDVNDRSARLRYWVTIVNVSLTGFERPAALVAVITRV